jgi:hypothetical protein
MKILDKAAQLEKALLDRIGRRSDITRHPLELYRAILDDIERACEPGTRGSRIFPYNQVAIAVATHGAHHRATAEAVFAEPPSLEERARTRLVQAGCAGVDALDVTVKFVDASGAEWSGSEYHLEFRRHRTARDAARKQKAALAPVQEVQLAVLAGKADRSRYALRESRINVGRLATVVDSQQRIIRHNHVAFADSDDAVNQTVSRTHAHIRFDRASGEARLHDDGSTRGTRVLRDGRTLEAPRGGRGITLRDGDEVQMGEARVRVGLKPPSKPRR